MSAMILFLCVAPEHAKISRDLAGQNVTIHQGRWAACPAGARDGHTWAETTGLDCDDLFRRRVAETNAARTHGDQPAGATIPVNQVG
ncbi:MAG: hypothetical protein M3Z65_00865 [Chloroflexota bacterium]|nr:hypothetical protein [Chloroflexota bacterium]